MNDLATYTKTGAALLDQELPSWYNQIDPQDLQMDDSLKCVLGTLYGDYYNGLHQLAEKMNGQSWDYGFNLNLAKDKNNAYVALKDCWVREILNRRTSDFVKG